MWRRAIGRTEDIDTCPRFAAGSDLVPWFVTGAVQRMPLAVLVVDDDKDIRGLLALILSRDPGVTVVGAAGDGEAAIEFVRYERPEAFSWTF